MEKSIRLNDLFVFDEEEQLNLILVQEPLTLPVSGGVKSNPICASRTTLFNTLDTSHLWLFTFKLIEVK